ncbi:hypothetical protein [Pseudoalteromonas piscicida]
MLSTIQAQINDPKVKTLLHACIFTMEQIKSRYESIEKEICFPHQVYPTQILGLGWDIIDWAEKLRKLLEVGRGIKKKDAWFKDIQSYLINLKDVRNFIQHFDKNVHSDDIAIIGELKVRLNHRYFPGLGEVIFTAHSSQSSDVSMLKFMARDLQYDWLSMSGSILDKVEISLANANVNLTELIASVSHARHGLNNYLYDKYYK